MSAIDLCVLGLGKSGDAVARYALARLGDEFSSVTVVDASDTPTLRAAAAELESRGAVVAVGSHGVDRRFDLVVASPGIPPHAEISVWARGAADEMISEIEFAWRRSVSPWIAVTGTNGKTTTTSLIGHLLTSAGMDSRVIGNIGAPAIDAVEGAHSATGMVAEVSSFQLAMTEAFHPRVAVLLNITPDHLDWHGSMETYVADKGKVFANMGVDDTAVIDVDDEGSAPWAERVEKAGVRVIRVTRSGLPSGGAGVLDGVLTLDTPAGALKLVDACDLKILGAHNVSNALAAAAAAHAFGAPESALRAGLVSFQPIAHRLEPAGVVGGVEYFDDSKATNPDAVLKALSAFGERPVVLLVGGRNKGNDFTELAEEATRTARAVVAFGEAGPVIADAFASIGADRPPLASTMAEAVRVASRLAEPGDAVVLSPACASFDEFADYTERGRAFKQFVAEAGRGAS